MNRFNANDVRHPWNRWFRRRRFQLVRGEDYRCQPHAMSVQVRNAAAKRNLRVSVQIEEGVLTITTSKE